MLNKEEESQLRSSVHGFQRTTSQESTMSDLDPFALNDDNDSEKEDDDDDPFAAPGAFPKPTASSQNAGNQGGSTTAMIESLVETLLARLQVAVNQVVIRYHHEVPRQQHVGSSNIDVDFRLDGIRYALHQTDPSVVPRKTLTIDDLSIWLANKTGEEMVKDMINPSSRSGKQEDAAMMMSFGIADLRESQYGQESVIRSRSAIREEEEEEVVGPALSLYESAIGETQEHSPSSTPPIDSTTSGARSVSFPCEGTKIFGIQQEGIVIQMWKEALPLDARSNEDSDSHGLAPHGRISVELGKMALKLDTEQLKALMSVVGSLVPKSQREQSNGTDPRLERERVGSPDSRIDMALQSLNVHYLYGDGGYFSSRTESFWRTLDPQIIEEDHLHLQVLPLTVDITQAEGMRLGFDGITLFDIHEVRSLQPALLAQPLLVCGSVKLPPNTWLPSTRDVEEAKSTVELGSNTRTRGRVLISKTGK